MIVLGIETSCDETGVGIVRLEPGGAPTLLANEIASSVEEHARFGGVVPEVASRAHLQAMVPTVHRALATAGVSPGDVAAVAVTAGPGLTGALLVGVAAAWDVPLYGVNHLSAHVAVDTLQHGPLPPCLALLVSGGHSSLLVGYAGLAFVVGPPRAEAEIHTIGVDPAYHRLGVGRTLLRGLLAVADDVAARVFLEVRTDNDAARALYEADGFTVVGLRKRYYRPSGADAYTMRREPR